MFQTYTMQNSPGKVPERNSVGSSYTAPVASLKTPQKLFYLLSGLRWGTADIWKWMETKCSKAHTMHNSTGEGTRKELSW